MEIKDLAGLSQPLTKLIDCVSCGIGKLYEPVHTKRMARAKAEEICLISEAANENINLPIKYSQGGVTVDSQDAEALLQRTGSRLLFQEMQKQQNIETVIENAYEDLKNEKEVSEEPVDKDWILRFFNSIEDISNEEMQKLWGKILAGEIKKPHSYSLRTLEIMKNLTQYEAKLFQKVAAFVFALDGNNGKYIFSNKAVLDSYGCYYSSLLQLDECGLINAQGLLSLNLKIDRERTSAVMNNEYIAFIGTDIESNKSVSVPVYPLKVGGIELLHVMNVKNNDEYFKENLRLIESNNQNIKIELHKIQNIDGSVINYEEQSAEL